MWLSHCWGIFSTPRVKSPHSIPSFLDSFPTFDSFALICSPRQHERANNGMPKANVILEFVFIIFIINVRFTFSHFLGGHEKLRWMPELSGGYILANRKNTRACPVICWRFNRVYRIVLIVVNNNPEEVKTSCPTACDALLQIIPSRAFLASIHIGCQCFSGFGQWGGIAQWSGYGERPLCNSCIAKISAVRGYFCCSNPAQVVLF